jgi:hypothetical protein
VLVAAVASMVVVAGALLAPPVASAQDPGLVTSTTVQVATTVPGASTTVAVDGTEDANQTVVEAPAPIETALFTESRKIMAIIGALVVVALLLALLTARYVRTTKPQPIVDPAPDEPDDADEVGVDPIPSVEVPIAEAPSADHHAADHDWEPRTGEHQRVDPPPTGVARPGPAARRAVLGGTTSPGVPVASGDG